MNIPNEITYGGHWKQPGLVQKGWFSNPERSLHIQNAARGVLDVLQ